MLPRHAWVRLYPLAGRHTACRSGAGPGTVGEGRTRSHAPGIVRRKAHRREREAPPRTGGGVECAGTDDHMTCASCGFDVRAGFAFCPKCGSADGRGARRRGADALLVKGHRSQRCLRAGTSNRRCTLGSPGEDAEAHSCRGGALSQEPLDRSTSEPRGLGSVRVSPTNRKASRSARHHARLASRGLTLHRRAPAGQQEARFIYCGTASGNRTT